MNLLMKLMGAATIAALASIAYAEVSDETLRSLGAPDKMKTRMHRFCRGWLGLAEGLDLVCSNKRDKVVVS